MMQDKNEITFCVVCTMEKQYSSKFISAIRNLEQEKLLKFWKLREMSNNEIIEIITTEEDKT